MPYPENTDNHFVVDPVKFDYYAMACYRDVGEDRLARTLADEVIRAGVDFDGRERAPMRIAEVRVTLGVAAARAGELDEAISQGQRALSSARQSLPHLAMLSQDLAQVLSTRYKGEPEADAFVDQLRHLQAGDAGRQ
jgi:hypothetical protein